MSDPLPTLPPHIIEVYGAYARMDSQLRAIGRKNDLNPAALLIVAFLGNRKVIPTELRDEIATMTNLSHNLNLLEDHRIIFRERGNDRRCRYVRLTDEGLRLCAQIRSALSDPVRQAEAA